MVSGDAGLCAGGAEGVGWVGVPGCFEHPLNIKTAVKEKSIERDTIFVMLVITPIAVI
jgi:hypothetical protein